VKKMSDLIETVEYDEKSSTEGDKRSINFDDISPGARLRYEREQRNLSIQNVADHLYLETRVIKCLENDEYDSLPPGIFIRGYIRNYAKYLEIPSEPLIKGYRELANEVEEEEESQPTVQQQKQKPVRRTNQVSSKDLWFKVLTFTIVITSLVLMALWRLNPIDSQRENAGDASTELIDNGESIQTLPINLEEEEMLLPSEGASEEENGSDNPNATTTSTPPPPVSSTNSSETTEFETEQSLEVTEAVEPETGDERKLKIFFDDVAWVGVIDGTEKELKSGTVSKGEVLTLEGQPPFKIKSARLDKIRVEYKGKTFSLKNHPDRDGKNVVIGEVME